MAVQAEVLAAYEAVRDDAQTADDWCLIGTDKAGNLSLTSRGAGGLKEVAAGFEDDKVQFAFVRLARTDDGGDSKRVKFVLLSWTGEAAGVLVKGRVGSQKSSLVEAFKGTHVVHALTERTGLATLEADVDAALRRAGGANYDQGNTNAGVKAGNSSGLKQASAAFFRQKDAETTIKVEAFEKFTRKGRDVSPCDLGNRAMTASATEAKRNVVGYAAE